MKRLEKFKERIGRLDAAGQAEVLRRMVDTAICCPDATMIYCLTRAVDSVELYALKTAFMNTKAPQQLETRNSKLATRN